MNIDLTQIHWLNTGTIPRHGDHVPDKEDFVFLAKIYVTGEELIDVEFENTVIDTIIAIAILASHCPIGEAVATIYEGTVAGSKARKIMVDFCARNANSNLAG